MSDNLKTWPEKVYLDNLNINEIPDYLHTVEFYRPKWLDVKRNKNDIEYIRKDIHDERVSRAETARTKYIHERIDYIGKQNKEIDELQNKVKELESQAAHLKTELNNHIALGAILVQDKDLPVDRIPAYKDMERLQERVKDLQIDRETLAHGLTLASSHAADLEAKVTQLEAEYIAKTWYPFQGEGNPEYEAKIIAETVEKCAQICEGTLLFGFECVGVRLDIANNIRALLPTNGSKE